MDERVVARMTQVMAMGLGNSAANHAAGRSAHDLIELARSQVAALVGANPANMVFTSGATEANNLAITGTVQAARARGVLPHIVTLATEHKSVLEPVRALVQQGVAASILNPDDQGLLSVDALAAALRPNTCLVSLLQVNNETGVQQDLAALSALCVARNVPLHVDACQSAGKVPVSVAQTALLSYTAHKLGGPQGIGALYVAPAHRGSLQPQIIGGGHERGIRAGTLATHQIVGFGLAAELARQSLASEAPRLQALRERLWQGLHDLPGVLLNGHRTARVPGILNLTFSEVEGESLFTGLEGLYLATGSACNSRSAEPSYVLRALGRDTEQAQSSLRFSFGRGTTEAQIEAAITEVRRVHQRLWALSPARPVPVHPVSVLGRVGTQRLGEAGAKRLGTWVRFAVQLQGDFVTDASVQVYGCPHTVEACKRVVEGLRGKPLDRSGLGTPEEWRVAVGAPVEKLGRILIIEDAVTRLLQG
jgi:cysteine desulfurase